MSICGRAQRSRRYGVDIFFVRRGGSPLPPSTLVSRPFSINPCGADGLCTLRRRRVQRQAHIQWHLIWAISVPPQGFIYPVSSAAECTGRFAKRRCTAKAQQNPRCQLCVSDIGGVGARASSTYNAPTGFGDFCRQKSRAGERWERCRWQMKRPERVAAVKGSRGKA